MGESGPRHGRPAFSLDGTHFPDGDVPMRWDVEKNGGIMLTSGSVGDPQTADDDVMIDSLIVTAENPPSTGGMPKLLEHVNNGKHFP